MVNIGGFDISPITSLVLGWVYMGFAVLILIGAGVAFWWLAFKKANYKTRVIIADKTSSPEGYDFDRGAIVKDSKTKRVMFKMLKAGVGLDPDFMMLRHDRKGKPMVFVGKYGFKNYAFLTPSVGDGLFKLGFTQEDVTWAKNEYERSKKMFQNSLLMQILPYAGLAFLIVAFIISMYFVTNKFDVLKDVAANLKEAALALHQANTGTTLIK
jgi:hypothetical protein